jgi:hypothetical protein
MKVYGLQSRFVFSRQPSHRSFSDISGEVTDPLALRRERRSP